MTRAEHPTHIGGFFELQLPSGGGPWHPDALALSTGRACMAAILAHTRPRKVRVPFYTCDALLTPMRDANVAVEFYALDDRLRPVDLPPPVATELVVAINYFGLQRSLITELAERHGAGLVADNTQAFFDKPPPADWAFCSARKFFGVPDGAYLYAPEALELRPLPNPRSDIRHLVNRLVGRQQTGYWQVRRHEQRIDSRIRSMSRLSDRLLAAVDYEAAQQRRRVNYLALHRALGSHNQFDADLPAGATPFHYPLLLPDPTDRAVLARHRLYVPTLWEDVITRASPRRFEFERSFASRLLPLPVDHRYTPADMEEVMRRLRKVVSL